MSFIKSVSALLLVAVFATASPTLEARAPRLDAVLNEHNSFRAQHGAAALTWNDQLASAAESWGRRCQFQHSGGAVGPYGENLWATGSSSASAPPANPVDGVKAFESEISSYDPNNPQPSHFTQVVWKGTRELGCAAVECGSAIFGSGFPQSTFLVCEYSPPGNVIGQFPQNVQK